MRAGSATLWSMREIVCVAHNMRSTHNVGSLLRTADGLGVSKVYLTGYTPHPARPHDTRLPHEAAKLSKQIQKTALGAKNTVKWQYVADIFELIEHLKNEGFTVAALEQAADAVPMPEFRPPQKTAVILGREVEGLETEVLQRCDMAL